MPRPKEERFSSRGGRIEAAEGIWFYITSVNKSPYYRGMKEYHGYFARSYPGSYEPITKSIKEFTFVAENTTDLKMKIMDARAFPQARRSLSDWIR